ncbi:hypothetical protein ABL78_6346 [Leptomonas seymouri]|uniref:Guanine nucleotide-binding protein subunit beta-like protein n=1 Tax=Leptomonas seymouri TaxID=5684 RepID=A0A0N1I3G5_LEPSE|nr:hypothetical protein ABL78_6346 [Leptomonas seymouri]|eukprot:KPI84585.1 hypothetical protein ABL78_6346 [Leptomonas seymouri]
MEFLGREAADVVSVACSSSSRTSFATLTGLGALTLWDVRLKRRNYISIDNPNAAAKAEASELRYFQDRHAAVVLCGNAVQLYDTRKSISTLAEYVHSKECVAFLKTAPPLDAAATLLVDEDGGMFPFSLVDGTKGDVIEAYVLGERWALPAGQDVFGHLDNYCSGLHCIDVSSDSGDSTAYSHVLFAVGMDGNGALYTHGEDGDAAVKRSPFCIMEAPQMQQKVQMVNPPLVNCTAVCRSVLAVGRADSTYTVYNVERDGPEALFEAPGHAVNGLCYVDWLSPDVLITTSLCGEVTGWNVGGFLHAADECEEEEGDLPDVVAALAHREVPGCQLATVNCGDRLGDSSYVFGDHMGGVTLARVEP